MDIWRRTMTTDLFKFPRTPHLEGSNLQPGDHDLTQVPFSEIAGRHLVVTEKVDGSNCGISFSESGELLLQSRGHYLTGGPRERHFSELKAWAMTHREALWKALGSRYIMFGEWMAAKHTVFYDKLPHLFLEFDIYDKQMNVFLATEGRRRVLAEVRVVPVSARWLTMGVPKTLDELLSVVKRSPYKSENWTANLINIARANGQDPELVFAQGDDSDLMEGIYIKVEEAGRVVQRLKWVRPDFSNKIAQGDGTPSGHWLDRPHLPNLLAEGVNIYP